MDCCWLLTSVNLDLPHLRSISLANNKKYSLVFLPVVSKNLNICFMLCACCFFQDTMKLMLLACLQTGTF